MSARDERIGLILSAGKLWLMSLPFRLAGRPPRAGFSPGLSSVVHYEARRLWHWLYERERLVWLRLRVLAAWRRR